MAPSDHHPVNVAELIQAQKRIEKLTADLLVLSAFPSGTDDELIQSLETLIRRERQLMMDMQWSGKRDG